MRLHGSRVPVLEIESCRDSSRERRRPTDSRFLFLPGSVGGAMELRLGGQLFAGPTGIGGGFRVAHIDRPVERQRESPRTWFGSSRSHHAGPRNWDAGCLPVPSTPSRPRPTGFSFRSRPRAGTSGTPRWSPYIHRWQRRERRLCSTQTRCPIQKHRRSWAAPALRSLPEFRSFCRLPWVATGTLPADCFTLRLRGSWCSM